MKKAILQYYDCIYEKPNLYLIKTRVAGRMHITELSNHMDLNPNIRVFLKRLRTAYNMATELCITYPEM